MFVAQHYGAGEHAEVGRVTDVGLALSVATGAGVRVVVFALAALHPLPPKRLAHPPAHSRHWTLSAALV